MANKISIVQQNLRKSNIATNEFKHNISQHINDIILVQEPNIFRPENKPVFSSPSDILYKQELNKTPDTAIVITNKSLIINLIHEFSCSFATTISIQCIDRFIIICNIYIRPNEICTEHIEFIENIINKYRNTPLIISGDFNARHLLWHDKIINRNGTKIFDIIDKHNLIIHNNKEKTCQTSNGNSIIDITLTNDHGCHIVQNWKTTNLTSFSDHFTIVFDISIYNLCRKKSTSTWKFNEKCADWKKYRTSFNPNGCEDLIMSSSRQRNKLFPKNEIPTTAIEIPGGTMI
uniref:Uncharacterized protein LOC113795535 n=1 Tax=Dermatophagoides pteronyssinus TaxID=6956 RepID=A0A6P6YAB4_DERPT|nr:uncharacterized protein LOC113795535 [Dermatophagoides pteronyssinus]